MIDGELLEYYVNQQKQAINQKKLTEKASDFSQAKGFGAMIKAGIEAAKNIEQQINIDTAIRVARENFAEATVNINIPGFNVARNLAGTHGASNIEKDPLSEIGEIDLEIPFRINLQSVEIQRLFGQIDEIRLREIKYGSSVMIGLIGAVFVGVLYAIMFNNGLDVIATMIISFVVLIVVLLGVYLWFSHVAKGKGKIDAKEMAGKYEEIKNRRNHLRNLTITFQKITLLKSQRTVEERCKQFLRKMNLMRLESLRLFSDESTDLGWTQSRVWELAFFSSETLSRMHN